MRINIYSQDLTKDVGLVVGRAADTGTEYVGIRMYLANADILSHTTDDDDPSSITFWIPNCGSSYNIDLERLLYQMAEMICGAKTPPRT